MWPPDCRRRIRQDEVGLGELGAHLDYGREIERPVFPDRGMRTAADFDAGGFANAQISVNLTSSTLSTHLASLERINGGPLCERGRGGFPLTALGQSTYAAAKQLFADIDTFHARISWDRGKLVGRLLVGIVDGVVTIPQLGLQDAVRAFMGYAEGVFIDLHPA